MLQWLNNAKEGRQSLEDTFSLSLALFLWQHSQAIGFSLLLHLPVCQPTPNPMEICSNDKVIEILKELQKLFQIFELLSEQH